MSTAIVWLRRDLRLADNPALQMALARHTQVVLIYLHAPQEACSWADGAASRVWLHHALQALQADLHTLNTRLILRLCPEGSLSALQQLVHETHASAVYWNRLYEPWAIARDTQIKQQLRQSGLSVESCNAAVLYEPWEIVKASGDPYQVFTPYWRAVNQRGLTLSLIERPHSIKPPATWPTSRKLAELELLPALSWGSQLSSQWEISEAAAHAQLQRFCQMTLAQYDTLRNRPDLDGCSRLSPYLHFGLLSPRQVCAAAYASAPDTEGLRVFLSEIGWREFAYMLLYHSPHTPEQPLQSQFQHYPWRSDYSAWLQAWQRGQTGIPLVDAGMRQLWHSGWMHNRVRMVVASFLCKHAQIPWQQGSRWFWDTLVDADLASNTLGWQWTAGCGADAAPYFRVFNPVRQAQQFDPNGEYIARWVPELAKVPIKWRAQPWAMPSSEAGHCGFVLGLHYPRPILDLEQQRLAALAGLKHMQAVGKE